MCGIDLDLVAPLGTHLAEGHLRVLEQHVVFHCSKANGNTRGVGHGVSTYAKQVGRIDASGSTEDELESVFGVELEARNLGRSVVHWGRNGRDALTVTVEIEGA